MKGQVSIVYLGILTVISLAIFGVILVWNLSIKDANTDLIVETEINSILEKVEADIYYIESLNKSGEFKIYRSLPNRLGEDFYTITLRADGTSNSKGGYLNNDQIIITKVICSSVPVKILLLVYYFENFKNTKKKVKEYFHI